MMKNYIFLNTLLFVMSSSYGQIGINTDKPRGIIDFSENSGGLVLPKSKNPEKYVRITSNPKGLAIPGTIIYDTQKNCMRVTSEVGKWSGCIGNSINGVLVLPFEGPIKGVGIQDTNPQGLLDLNNDQGISDMGFVVPQVNSTNGLSANQIGSFVFDESKKCLKFVFKDYDNKNKWSGCMNHLVNIGSDSDQREGSRPLNLTGGIGIGTENPKGILDVSQSSQPMILPLLDNALLSHDILASGTLVYDKSARALRIVYKDSQGKLRWSSHLPGADYCGYSASNGGGKVYAIKEGVVKFWNKGGTFFLNDKMGRSLSFWVKGGANDSGALYAESWLPSTYIGMNYIGITNGKIIIEFHNSPHSHNNFYKVINENNFRLDGKWHYFVFEKTNNREITIYVDDMKNSLIKVIYPGYVNYKDNMTITLGAQKKCCSDTGNPSYNVFKGEYTVASFWTKNLNEEERILSKYGHPKNGYGMYIPYYGNNYVKDYAHGRGQTFPIGDSKVKIVPADDLPVPFGRNLKVFNAVSSIAQIKLKNNETGDEFTVIPVKGTAKRVVIYESLDSPTNAEDHNLYKDFFGIDIEGASTDFKYNIQYKRKKLICEDDLVLYIRGKTKCAKTE